MRGGSGVLLALLVLSSEVSGLVGRPTPTATNFGGVAATRTQPGSRMSVGAALATPIAASGIQAMQRVGIAAASSFVWPVRSVVSIAVSVIVRPWKLASILAIVVATAAAAAVRQRQACEVVFAADEEFAADDTTRWPAVGGSAGAHRMAGRRHGSDFFHDMPKAYDPPSLMMMGSAMRSDCEKEWWEATADLAVAVASATAEGTAALLFGEGKAAAEQRG